MSLDGKVDAADIPVVDTFYKDVFENVEEIFRESGLSEKYELSGFNVNFELKPKSDVDSSETKLEQPIEECSDFIDSLFNFLRIYKLEFQYLQVDESERQLLEDNLNSNVNVSDCFKAKEFCTVLDKSSFDLKKDYTGFYLNGGITGYQPVLIVYCHEPATVLVNTTKSGKINAEQILVEFF